LSIYGGVRRTDHKLSLARLRLDSRSFKFLVGLPEFSQLYSLELKNGGLGVIASGEYAVGGQMRCGLVDIGFKPAAVRPIRSEVCGFSGSWRLLSVSPVNSLATAESEGATWTAY
jgi:hypothetical protein